MAIASPRPRWDQGLTRPAARSRRSGRFSGMRWDCRIRRRRRGRRDSDRFRRRRLVLLHERPFAGGMTVATASAGRILRTFLIPNTHIRGFRAGVDVAVDPGQSTGPARLPLRAGPKCADRDLDLSLACVRAGKKRPRSSRTGRRLRRTLGLSPAVECAWADPRSTASAERARAARRHTGVFTGAPSSFQEVRTPFSSALRFGDNTIMTLLFFARNRAATHRSKAQRLRPAGPAAGWPGGRPATSESADVKTPTNYLTPQIFL